MTRPLRSGRSGATGGREDRKMITLKLGPVVRRTTGLRQGDARLSAHGWVALGVVREQDLGALCPGSSTRDAMFSSVDEARKAFGLLYPDVELRRIH